MKQGRWTGGGHVFFSKYSCNLSYIFIKKNPFLLYFLSKVASYSDCIFFKTFFAVSKPKATNSRVSDGYLAQTQQFSVITCREQPNFK
jgi:hypothetical protein